MKHNISFVTGLFEAGTPIDRPGSRLQGEDLAKWLVDECVGDEFTFAAPVEEAAGWSVITESQKEQFKLGFQITKASIGDNHAEWKITIESVRGWNLFAAKDSPVRRRLCDLIHNVLREEGETREVQWG